jgi:hypothetical protein
MYVDQGKDGQISTHEDGRSLSGLYRVMMMMMMMFVSSGLMQGRFYPNGPDKNVGLSCKCQLYCSQVKLTAVTEQRVSNEQILVLDVRTYRI